MTPPIWLDEHGQRRPTRPYPRCGREASVHFNGFRIEHLKHLAWCAYHVEAFVNWCGTPRTSSRGPRRTGRCA